MTTPANHHALVAHVKSTFTLRNTTNERNESRREFSVAAPPLWSQSRKDTWCRVTLNGKSVPVRTVAAVERDSQTVAMGSSEQRRQWKDRIRVWVEQDKVSTDLVTRYQELAKASDEINTITEEFQKRIKQHLVHGDELAYTVTYVATGDTWFSHVVKLMPEVDPTFRIDADYQRWKYVSLLDENSVEKYRPYEQQWRKQIDLWLAAKPDIAELLPKLRRVWSDSRASQKLLNGPILKHLHDQRGLSLATAIQMKSYLGSRQSLPSAELARAMFPDVREKLDAEAAEVKQRLTNAGFDSQTLSPFTGELIAESGHHHPFSDWRDESVQRALGQTPSTANPPRYARRTERFAPVLISFDARLEPNESAAVKIEFEVDVQPLSNPFRSAIFLPNLTELAVVIPPADKTSIIVTCLPDIHPILSPAPTMIGLRDHSRQFSLTVTGDSKMMHMVFHDGKRPDNWLGRFRDQDEDDLKTLAQTIDNPTVRPLLQTALYSIWLQSLKLWEAHELAIQISADQPDFAPILEALQKQNHQAKQAKGLHEWVTAKSVSPSLTSEDDFKRFEVNSTGALTRVALQELADRVKTLRESDLDLAERMGRRFILCQAGQQTGANLAEMVKLAELNPSYAIEALTLIRHLEIDDKSAALPFVLDQFDLELRAKARAGKVKSTDFLWLRQNAAYHALGTFRSPKAAPDILRFLPKTDDSLLLQGAVQALSHMTLPSHFDELASINEFVVKSSESAFMQYLDLLLRSDPSDVRARKEGSSPAYKRAFPLLESLAEKHPQFAPRVTRALGRAQHPDALKRALAAYRQSKDGSDELQESIGVISGLAKPKHIASLTYRAGLPMWMNESLVSIIRENGGDASNFPFVEAFYKEHVRGDLSHHHLTCVAAMEAIGDARAIPYLREIFKSTERKRDAATAIGSLLLPKAVKITRANNPMDALLETVANPSLPKSAHDSAWKVLLADADASFQRAMEYGVIRDAIEGADSEWAQRQNQKAAFITRFGDVAAGKLLKASEGCSLQARYRYAELLQFVLPESQTTVETAANDVTGDEDRRLTAQLALNQFHARSAK